MATVYVIGAGLAGLSAAVSLAARGLRVVVCEGAGHGGGRARSFFDDVLGCRIDNGNHLLLSGNRSTQAYLRQIGSETSLVAPDRASYPFMDLRNGEKWTVRPDPGRIPWSLIRASGRVPGTAASEYLRGLRLAWAASEKTVRQCLDGKGLLFERFWEPLAVSVLNTEADAASARLLWPVLKETFGRGGKACIPLIPRQGLSESFVDPALAYLETTGNRVLFNHRLKDLASHAGRVTALGFADKTIDLHVSDRVIVAVPPTSATALIPGLAAPDRFRAIVNGHFRIPGDVEYGPFLGLVGGISHWLFVRNTIASVTVSAASDLVSLDAPEIAARLWPEICQALDLGNRPLGAYRIVKEKRATFAQTPEQIAKRPPTTTRYENLLLAGDWVDNGLPATIEGSIRSGQLAADLIES